VERLRQGAVRGAKGWSGIHEIQGQLAIAVDAAHAAKASKAERYAANGGSSSAFAVTDSGADSGTGSRSVQQQVRDVERLLEATIERVEKKAQRLRAGGSAARRANVVLPQLVSQAQP
jgi:hypothetical protein